MLVQANMTNPRNKLSAILSHFSPNIIVSVLVIDAISYKMLSSMG